MFERNCARQNDFTQNFTGDGDINMDIDVNMMNNQVPMNAPMMGNVNAPIIEPMQERIVNRTIMHEVPQV